MADIPSNIPGAPTGAGAAGKKRNRQGPTQKRDRPHQFAAENHPRRRPSNCRRCRPAVRPALPAPCQCQPAGAKTPSSAPTTTAPRTAAAAAAAPVSQARPAPAAQRAVSAAVPTIGALDNILVIAATVAALLAAGTVVWMLMILKKCNRVKPVFDRIVSCAKNHLI